MREDTVSMASAASTRNRSGIRRRIMLREQGSRDWRMLPAAMAAWAASLSMHRGFAMVMAVDPYDRWAVWTGVMVAFAPMMPLAVAAAVAAMLLRAFDAVPPMARHRRVRRGIRCRRRIRRLSCRFAAYCRCQLPMMLMAALLASVAALSVDLVQWHDPASEMAREPKTIATVEADIVAPATVSDLRDAACQADIVLRSLARNGVTRTSTATGRLFASDGDCSAIAIGTRIRIRGVLQEARFGDEALWLVAETPGTLEAVGGPRPMQALVTRMQQAFFAVTNGLSDQGRVLVPGLTLGVLGQDHIAVGDIALSDDADVSGGVDATYAAAVEDRFRRSGIIHLMAVSGGHFVLIADMIRRLCSRLLLPRQVVAAAVAVAYLLLASIMYPSDSVLRALVMGLIGTAALAIGRRGQSMSALSWTVLGCLTIAPKMSCSFGFALSCAAVLGIVMFSRPIADRLEALMPRFLASMTATTVAAQLFTLPIQILMEPELPLVSVPANLLVSPFVGFATMSGLASLAVSWLNPDCGFILAWIAGCGTQVMERVATWLSSGRYAVIPWKDGVTGMLAIAAAEIAVALMLALIIGAADRHGTRETGLPGRAFRPRRRDGIIVWAKYTERMFEDGDVDPSSGERR